VEQKVDSAQQQPVVDKTLVCDLTNTLDIFDKDMTLDNIRQFVVASKDVPLAPLVSGTLLVQPARQKDVVSNSFESQEQIGYPDGITQRVKSRTKLSIKHRGKQGFSSSKI
jgi:hypothetical protein